MALINSVELDMHSLYIDQAEALLSQKREALLEESSQIQKLTCKTTTVYCLLVSLQNYFVEEALHLMPSYMIIMIITSINHRTECTFIHIILCIVDVS